MELLRAIKLNETIPQDEFTAVMNEYGTSVYRFCRSLTFSREDADDLFQETFLNVFEQKSKGKLEDNPQSFLFSTSLYIWKGWKRKHARRKRLAPVEPLDENIPSNVEMEDIFIAQEEIRSIRKAVEALPDKFKIPIILHYTIEMNVSDIASTLKLPAGTVKSRLFKARKLIEKGLVQHEQE